MRDPIKPHLPDLTKYREIQSKRERLRKLQAELPERDREQDLSWMVEEYAAARPSIRRAEQAERHIARLDAAHQGDPEE